MRGIQPIPGKLDGPLDAFLSIRMPPSTSRVKGTHRETTIRYPYMCSYAYGCPEKAERPAQVLMRRCMRYRPESMRIEPALSDLALALLAKRRQEGQQLSPVTTAHLKRARPGGPIRKRI